MKNKRIEYERDFLCEMDIPFYEEMKKYIGNIHWEYQTYTTVG